MRFLGSVWVGVRGGFVAWGIAHTVWVFGGRGWGQTSPTTGRTRPAWEALVYTRGGRELRLHKDPTTQHPPRCDWLIGFFAMAFMLAMDNNGIKLVFSLSCYKQRTYSLKMHENT